MNILSTTRQLPAQLFRLFLPLLLLSTVLAAVGCGETEQQSGNETPTFDSTVTPLVNYHPILDAKVRAGDSMLYDLTTLLEEGLIVEKDMQIIGMYVRGHGGIEQTDSALTAMTYRHLLDLVFTRDMSHNAAPCKGCNDSVIILIPGNSTRIYIGKGRKGLQEMIREALKETEGDTPPNEPPLNQPVTAENWQEVIHASMEGREQIDWVLFGNTIIVLNQDGKKLSDYTYGRVLAVVEAVRDMDEFDDVKTLYGQLETQ